MDRADDRAEGNVAQLVRIAARHDAAHLALFETGSGAQLSWGELDAAVDATARRLRDAGVRDGDRVVVRLPGAISYCVAVFGVLRAGGVLVPLAKGAAPRELAEVLSSSGASLLFADADDDTAAEVAATAGATVLAPPDPVADVPPPVADAVDDADAAAGPVGSVPDGPAAVEPATGGEDIAVVAYTSGTSGVARGVMLSHRALLANVAQCSRLRPAPVTPADRVLLALPLFHVYGLGPGLLQVANAGATAVLAGRFDAAESLAAIARHRVTAVVGVPPMYRAWLRIGGDDLARAFSTVRLATSGAAPLDPALAEEFRAATGVGVYEGYGLTETGPVLTSTIVGGAPKPGSVGRAIPGVEIRLVDVDGTPLGGGVGSGADGAAGSGSGSGSGSGDPNEVDLDFDVDLDLDDPDTGLVAARGANLFSGYWPDGAHGPDADGWFRTGDVGFLDRDGDLRLVDRASDLIIVNGFNVYPHEVERALLEHDAIAAAAVVGTPDEESGETVRALLVLTGELTASALAAHVATRLARYKQPTIVEIVDELPVTPTGKLARRDLRAVAGRALA